MANVRVAQIGQTAANRPIFEVMVDSRRYCFAVIENGKVQFKPRDWLFSLGVCSVVCDTFLNKISTQDAVALNLDFNNSTDRSNRFVSQTYGSGFAWVPDFSVFSGWPKIYPVNGTNFTV